MTANLNQPSVSFHKKSDDIFHLSPFMHLQENTISPIYDTVPRNIITGSLRQDPHSGEDSSIRSEGIDNMAESRGCQVSQFL